VGRAGAVAAGFGFAAAGGVGVCAWAQAPAATNINVAVSIDLMTNLGVIDVPAIKHICLVGNNRSGVQASTLPDDQETTAPC
jgi:hypothetical protein